MNDQLTDNIGNVLENPNQLQSHGLTIAEMAELQQRQKNGLALPMIPANNAASGQIKDPYFQPYVGHTIPRHEAHCFHVLTDGRTFDTRTGEKLSVVVLNTFTPEAFEFQKEHGGFSGQVVHVLHNPTFNRR